MAPRATSKRLNSSSYQGVLCNHLNSRVSGQVQTRMLLIVHWRDATDCHLNSASGLGHSFPSSWSVASWGLRDPFPEIVLNKMKLSAWLMILSGTAYIQRLVQTEKKKAAHALQGGQAHPSSMIWLKPLLTLHHSSNFPSVWSFFPYFLPVWEYSPLTSYTQISISKFVSQRTLSEMFTYEKKFKIHVTIVVNQCCPGWGLWKR